MYISCTSYIICLFLSTSLKNPQYSDSTIGKEVFWPTFKEQIPSIYFEIRNAKELLAGIEALKLSMV